MPSYDEIMEKVHHLNKSQKFLVKKELKELPNILEDDEAVGYIAAATFGGRNGVLVATDRRVIFAEKGLRSMKIQDLPYCEISSVQYRARVLLGDIIFSTSKGNTEIKNIERALASDIADYARAKTEYMPE